MNDWARGLVLRIGIFGIRSSKIGRIVNFLYIDVTRPAIGVGDSG
jgi:hypothetical protein